MTRKILLFFIIIILFFSSNYFLFPKSASILELPEMDHVFRIILLKDYNTRVVVLGTVLLGLAAGILGTFTLLRKRSLMTDAISHATLPGIGIAFIIMTIVFKNSGKNLFGLLLGAVLSGLIGIGITIFITKNSKIKEETALGVTLSVFFGLGISILGIIQKMKSGHAAGLESFIYGKTASMLASDSWMIAVTALIILIICTLLFKEFKILCFDGEFANSQGWPVLLLDLLLMALITIITVIGLQAVGLILIIALLIIPAAASRFWTNNLFIMIIISSIIGILSGFFGAIASAMFSKLPAGAVIVVIGSTMFFISMIFGKSRGILIRIISHILLINKVNSQHLLRGFYEYFENNNKNFKLKEDLLNQYKLSINEILKLRTWTKFELNKILLNTKLNGFLKKTKNNTYILTKKGRIETLRVVKNHRMWELYLINHADVATGKVDRDADYIEHILEPEIIKELEGLLKSEYPNIIMPESPHTLEA